MITKPNLRNVGIACILSLCLSSFAAAEDDWKLYENADGSKRFIGNLVAYDAKRNIATIVMQNDGKQVSFDIGLLTKEDQSYVKQRGQQLSANSSLRCKFDKKSDQTAQNKGGDTTTTSYSVNFGITLENFAPTDIDDIEVEHMIIWRKDSFDGAGTDQFTTGSKKIGTIKANGKSEYTTAGVPIIAVYKKGSSTTTGGACPKCPKSTTSIPSERSRDIIVGCIARIKVAGKVVKTEATSPGVLGKYRDEFPSTLDTAAAK